LLKFAIFVNAMFSRSLIVAEKSTEYYTQRNGPAGGELTSWKRTVYQYTVHKTHEQSLRLRCPAFFKAVTHGPKISAENGARKKSYLIPIDRAANWIVSAVSRNTEEETKAWW